MKKAPVKRKKKSKIYFGLPVQEAIIEYNHSEDTEFKHKIYTETIHPAFMKLAENIINTFKFSYFDYGFRDLQEEVVSNLLINMHKYDETRGSKAFSYFSIIAKNYLILNNNANYKKLKTHDDLTVLSTKADFDNNLNPSPTNDIFDKTISYFDTKLEELFPSENDRHVAESILYLCKNKDSIDNYNKKALYIMIREMTDVKTSKITQVSNIFRSIYPKIQKEVLEKGHIEDLMSTTGSIG
tara:strand:- start:25616 stop:26338 length:723 start_codon:yes stop_codon:yes gene_type:complete